MLAEILGSVQGIATVREAWIFQGEDSIFFWLERVVEVYETADQEHRSYIIFILQQMIQNEIIIPVEDPNHKEKLSSSSGVQINSEQFIWAMKEILLQNKDEMDFLELLEMINKTEKNLEDLELTEVVLSQTAHLLKTKFSRERTLKSLLAFVRHQIELIEKKKDQEDQEEGMILREKFFLKVREKLASALIYLYHTDKLTKREFKSHLNVVFDDLRYKKLNLRQNEFFDLVILLDPVQVNFCQKLHTLVLKFSSRVIFLLF